MKTLHSNELAAISGGYDRLLTLSVANCAIGGFIGNPMAETLVFPVFGYYLSGAGITLGVVDGIVSYALGKGVSEAHKALFAR
jgi:bacteriocin-like protein